MATRSVQIAVTAFALLLAASGAWAAADGNGGSVVAKSDLAAAGANCGSLVIRTCRLRPPSV
ncbi:MAG TPA: hypothetical protein VEE84_01165, partial [Burkholderiaceae bacterium]|nr:hypothetical protein [Burkholderiaceae bacterium]